MDKIITVDISKSKFLRANPQWRYNHGQKLKFTGVELPPYYEVHFSNSVNGTAKRQLGDSTGVLIPFEFFVPGKTIYAWIYIEDEDSGVTQYQIQIPIHPKARCTDVEPTPEEQELIEETIAALNSAIEHLDEATDAIPGIIDEALQEAKDSGEFDGPPGEPGPIGPAGHPVGSVSRIYYQPAIDIHYCLSEDITIGFEDRPTIGDILIGPLSGVSKPGTTVWQIDNLLINPRGWTLKYIGSIKGAQGDPGINGIDGSTIWLSSTAPTTPDYTFNKSQLVGTPNAVVKLNDLVLYGIKFYKIINIAQNTVLTSFYVELKDLNTLSKNGDEMNGILNMTSHKIINVADGSSNNDAVNFKQVKDMIAGSAGIFRGSFATKAALLAVQWQSSDPSAANYVGNNDFAVVLADESSNNECWRYCYTIGSGWAQQYRVNEAPLSSSQMDAINSGITAQKVEEFENIPIVSVAHQSNGEVALQIAQGNHIQTEYLRSEYIYNASVEDEIFSHISWTNEPTYFDILVNTYVNVEPIIILTIPNGEKVKLDLINLDETHEKVVFSNGEYFITGQVLRVGQDISTFWAYDSKIKTYYIEANSNNNVISLINSDYDDIIIKISLGNNVIINLNDDRYYFNKISDDYLVFTNTSPFEVKAIRISPENEIELVTKTIYSKPDGGIPLEDLAEDVPIVPDGGATGQVLAKISDDNYDYDWVTPSGGSITVDSALSSTSENPVQNKIIAAELNTKGTYSKPSTGIPASDLEESYAGSDVIVVSSTQPSSDTNILWVKSSAEDVVEVPTWSEFQEGLGAKYTLPGNGIPKTDLAISVQSSLNKADTALQSYTETDPTVPSWAKASNKPSYTAADVGAVAVAQGSENAGKFLVVGNDGAVTIITLATWQGGSY